MLKKNNSRSLGEVISVQGPVVDVRFASSEDVPELFERMSVKPVEGEDVILEVAEHLPGDIARCIAINSTMNVRRKALSEKREKSGEKWRGGGIRLLGRTAVRPLKRSNYEDC